MELTAEKNNQGTFDLLLDDLPLVSTPLKHNAAKALVKDVQVFLNECEGGEVLWANIVEDELEVVTCLGAVHPSCSISIANYKLEDYGRKK